MAHKNDDDDDEKNLQYERLRTLALWAKRFAVKTINRAPTKLVDKFDS